MTDLLVRLPQVDHPVIPAARHPFFPFQEYMHPDFGQFSPAYREQSPRKAGKGDEDHRRQLYGQDICKLDRNCFQGNLRAEKGRYTIMYTSDSANATATIISSNISLNLFMMSSSLIAYTGLPPFAPSLCLFATFMPSYKSLKNCNNIKVKEIWCNKMSHIIQG